MTRTATTKAKTEIVSRDDLGFLLAKATQRWNELLTEHFATAGYGDISMKSSTPQR